MFSWLMGLFGSSKPSPVSEEPATTPASQPVYPYRQPQPVKDPYYPYRPLFDLLGKSEGTDRGRGYNETLAYGKLTGGPVELVKMNLEEIDALQTRMLKHPDNKWNSSAVGRYQIVRTTLRRLKKNMELLDSTLYDAKTQDHCCLYLLEGRGLSRYLDGSMKEDTFINNMAKEWASIPRADTGKGHYGGQKAGVTLAEVRAALAEVKRRMK